MRAGFLQRLRSASRTEGSPERTQQYTLDPSNPFASPQTPPTVPATADSSPEDTTVRVQAKAESPTLAARSHRKYTTPQLAELRTKLQTHAESIQAVLKEGELAEPLGGEWVEVSQNREVPKQKYSNQVEN